MNNFDLTCVFRDANTKIWILYIGHICAILGLEEVTVLALSLGIQWLNKPAEGILC
jgi:hypothetical protein